MKTRMLLCAFVVLALAGLTSAQLSGSYTVDPNGSGPRNFTNLAAAVGALGAGVSGPVTFDVKPGTYQGLLVVTPVAGTSSLNTVTFVTKGTTPAVIDANGGSVGMFVFDGTAWVNFTNFKVQNFTKYGIYMLGFSPGPGVTQCTFTRVEFIAPASSSSSVNAAKIDYCHSNTFVNCRFVGGGYTLYSQQMKLMVFDGCEFDGLNTASNILAPYNGNDYDNLFQNCFFHDCGPSGRGLYINVSGYGNMFWHNTIIVTTSTEAVWAGNCCAWSRACSYRNNIIVNLGSGTAMKYGCSASVLDYNDFDYNCYYAPNSTKGAVAAENTGIGFTTGTLAQWKTFFNANMNTIVPTGGPTPAQASFDQNSIEGDPGLVSMKSPYDIHLKAGSPMVDAGTTKYIAGPWISFNPNATVTTDFEGDARGTLVDIGADEQAIRIIATGSPTPGGTVTFLLSSSSDPGLPYQVGTSLGTGPIPIGTRSLGLSPDFLLLASTSGSLPGVFQNYSGVLDQNGQAQAKLNIPNLPALKGTRLYSAFLTLKIGAPQNIQSISNTELVTVQ